MIAALLSRYVLEHYRPRIDEAMTSAGQDWEPILLPDDPAVRLDDEACARAGIAFFSSDMVPDYSRSFFSAAQRGSALKWIHVFNVGTDLPVFQRLLGQGIRITNSAGSTAQPIAQTAVAGVLMLARGFPGWLDAQRRRAWAPLANESAPRDLVGQRMTIVGVGAIGNEIGRLAGAIGLDVVGVRRTPMHDGDHVREIRPPADLPGLLPDTDWLVIACPLTEETRGLIGARELELLPPGACVVNVGRGEVIREADLIAALQAGKVAGAYLDVFEVEPLPDDSPLWTLPNVIVTPHNSGIARGNAGRATGLFLHNLPLWLRNEALLNEVRA